MQSSYWYVENLKNTRYSIIAIRYKAQNRNLIAGKEISGYWPKAIGLEQENLVRGKT